MNTEIMQKQIMRRVYYSYIVSLFAHPMMWQGVFLGAAAILLARWLFVASIINNFLAIPVGRVPEYAYNAVVNAATNGELLTVITLFAAGIVAISAGYRIANTVLPGNVWVSRA